MFRVMYFVVSISAKLNLGMIAAESTFPHKGRLLNFRYLERKVQVMSCHGILVFLEGITHIVCTASWGRCPWNLAEMQQND